MDEPATGSNPEATTDLPFADRRGAGRALARPLRGWHGRKDVLVLALSRGGTAVAREVAAVLGAELDLLPASTIAVPGRESLSLGAVTVEDDPVWNEAMLRRIGGAGEAAVQRARRDAAQLESCRGTRPRPRCDHRCVILVDDGLVTGARMRAAAATVRRQQPAWIMAAVPVAPPEAAASLRNSVDEVVCLAEPEPFYSISEWYLDYSPISDAEMGKLLATGC